MSVRGVPVPFIVTNRAVAAGDVLTWYQPQHYYTMLEETEVSLVGQASATAAEQQSPLLPFSLLPASSIEQFSACPVAGVEGGSVLPPLISGEVRAILRHHVPPRVCGAGDETHGRVDGAEENVTGAAGRCCFDFPGAYVVLGKCRGCGYGTLC